MGRLPARCRCWRLALAFFAVATPGTRWLAQAHGMAFWVGFFRFQQFWERLHLRACTATPGGLLLAALVLLLLLPCRSMAPWPSPGSGYWRRAGWRKQPRASQLAPFCLVWFLVVFVVLLPAALNGWLHPCRWCLQERCLISLYWIPLRGHRQGPLALIGHQRWMGSFQLPWGAPRLMANAAAFCTTLGRPPIRPPYPDFSPSSEELRPATGARASVFGCRC